MNKKLSFKAESPSSFVNMCHTVFGTIIPNPLLHVGGTIKQITHTCLFLEAFYSQFPPKPYFPEGVGSSTFVFIRNLACF